LQTVPPTVPLAFVITPLVLENALSTIRIVQTAPGPRGRPLVWEPLLVVLVELRLKPELVVVLPIPSVKILDNNKTDPAVFLVTVRWVLGPSGVLEMETVPAQVPVPSLLPTSEHVPSLPPRVQVQTPPALVLLTGKLHLALAPTAHVTGLLGIVIVRRPTPLDRLQRPTDLVL